MSEHSIRSGVMKFTQAILTRARNRGASVLETVAGNALRAAGLRQDKFNYRWTYQRHVSRLKTSGSGLRSAMEAAVGGAFESQGIMQREILIQAGLPKDGYVIDVGCGSGRLAKPLSEYLDGNYLGIDVVPDLSRTRGRSSLARSGGSCLRPD